MVNTHVTSPGATMALGLMYLKTNNRCALHPPLSSSPTPPLPSPYHHDILSPSHRTVAAMLDTPDTHYKLDCVRPDFLLYRVRDPPPPSSRAQC